jgi:hypothetical protein
MRDVLSGDSTEGELLLVSEMCGGQLPLHSNIALLIVVGSDGVGDKR